MATTLITYSIVRSVSVEQPPAGQPGHRAVFTVTAVENIDANIFVRQREVAVAGQDNFVDSFYTVASVADMAALPAGFSSMDEPFYRVNTIDLVFPTVPELEKYVAQIQRLIALLRDANDLAINMQTPVVVTIP